MGWKIFLWCCQMSRPGACMQASTPTTPLFFHTRTPSADAVELFGREYHQLEKQLAEWFFRLLIHEQWSRCRLQNSRARDTHILRPLLTTSNRTPHFFPSTLAELRRLDLTSVLNLLKAYEQQVPANIKLDAARRHFARFIGAPV
ncbi:hypothetical protein FB45DRAFT_940591 [Roridomyces roridus]|uniref:Uncharacterized protein n=1 Tax=Roridomyces roridus TaxID=1738132 RepID=A0AAD7B6P5_9AGAR|nr:hypothetical protein FB45DRAFT_940591 [Roridomyces roridus]